MGKTTLPESGEGTVQVAATLGLDPHTYDLMLRILSPATRTQRSALARIPSQLGRDILAHFVLLYDDQEELVLLLEPDEAADLRRHLP